MMSWIDLGVIVLYLVGITAFGCSFYFRKGTDSAKVFMTGTGQIPNGVVALSLLATIVIFTSGYLLGMFKRGRR